MFYKVSAFHNKTAPNRAGDLNLKDVTTKDVLSLGLGRNISNFGERQTEKAGPEPTNWNSCAAIFVGVLTWLRCRNFVFFIMSTSEQ